MSDRSQEWYSDPSNAERRKKRMRAYGRAQVELGRRHALERKQLYRAGVARGMTPTASQAAALAYLRSVYPAEFTRLFEEQRGADQGTAAQPN